MLEKVNLKLDLSHKEYQKLLPDLQRRLYDLEKACWDQKIASMIVFEGWDASGKGSAVAELTARLDPRGYKLYPIQPPRTYERQYPWLRRFWLRTPNYGEMAIFDRSWYRRVLDERVEEAASEQEWRRAYRDITDFERMLSDDGVVIVKFWLHIGKQEQRKRFKALEKDPLESWHVTPEDWERHRRYNKYRRAVEEMLELTDSEFAPWRVVEATSRWFARRKIYDLIIGCLERRLGADSPPVGQAKHARKPKREGGR